MKTLRYVSVHGLCDRVYNIYTYLLYLTTLSVRLYNVEWLNDTVERTGKIVDRSFGDLIKA
jgi:hypothetical protein